MKRQEWPEVTVCTEESEGDPGDCRCLDYVSHDATRRGRRQHHPLPGTTSPMRPCAPAGTAAGEAPRALPAGSGSPQGERGDGGRAQRAVVTVAAPGGGGGVYGAGGARSSAASEAYSAAGGAGRARGRTMSACHSCAAAARLLGSTLPSARRGNRRSPLAVARPEAAPRRGWALRPGALTGPERGGPFLSPPPP